MSVSQAEIDFGKAAIARRLATQDQVRECVSIQQRLPQPLHLGAILVKKGYMSERDARELMAQLERTPSGGGVAPSGYGSPSSFGSNAVAAPAPVRGSAAVAAPPSPYPNALAATCSACGARFPISPQHAGQRFRCRACGATVVAPQAAPPPAEQSNFGRRSPEGSGYRAPPQAPPAAPADPNGSAFVRPPGAPPRPGGGLHGTQVVGGPDETKGPASFAIGGGSPGSAPGGDAVPSNLAADDPIAHVMEARRASDGSVETVFGPYDIIGEIARGGMGIVYRARQRDLKRIVALKVMKEGEGASKKQIKRFQRETETAAKLQHPNIVAVHEVGCHQGFHYFTMDLIEGDALDQLVKRGEKLGHDRVLTIVEEVARAIHYAHGKGIIHRDLKPANILLDTDGHPKVTDFGLAKSIDHKSMLTRTGAVVGTPFYMPPEQARGDNDIDQRADVYALGVILYELLTLKLPFHGETTMEVYRKILEEEPLPPRHHDPTIQSDVQTIVQKAMDRDPGRRYQNAKDLADDIQRFLQGEPITARPMGPIEKLWRKARKNVPVVVVGTITVLAITCSFVVIVWRHRKAVEDNLRISKQVEWDTFTREFENQKINVKSQINSATARMKDRDPNGALADLREGIRLLDELPKLVQDWKLNTKDDADRFFAKEKTELSGVYRDAWRETGNAWQMRETSEGFDEALNAYKKALEFDPASKEALDVHLAIGKVLAKMGKHQEALDTLGTILAKDPSHVKTLLERGNVHDLRGEHRKAIEDYSRIIEKELESNDAHLARGASYFALHQYEDAKRDFEHVIEHRENDFHAFTWRGRVKQALGDYSGASDDLTEAIDQQPSYPEGYYYRAELYFAQRKHAEAIKDYEVAITRSAQYYQAYVGLGRVLEWTLDYERAGQQYDEVLKGEDRAAETERPRALAAKAHLVALRADRLEVLAETEQKLREEKADKGGTLGPPPTLADLEKRAGEERAKKEKQARELYDEALKLSPKLVVALVGRARLSLAENDRKAARADLLAAEAALAERPWVVARGGAERDSERGTGGHDPELSEVQALLGHAALLDAREARSSDAGEVVRRFEAALASDKENAMALAGLGLAALLKQPPSAEAVTKAREWFRKARVLEGESEKVDENKVLPEETFFELEGKKNAQNADRSKKPEFYVQARQSFARAISKDPYHALAYLERARLASSWRAWDLALEDATQAIAADPFLRDAHELRGFLYGRDLPEKADERTQRPKVLRDRARAIDDFTRAVEIAASGEGGTAAAAEALYGRALARTGLQPPSPGDGAPAASKPDAEDLKAGASDVVAAIGTIPADLLRWMDDEKTSTDRIRAAVEFHELHQRILLAQGDEAGARTASARAAEVRAQAREAAKKAHELGKVLRDRRNYSDAINKFDRGIALDPELADAFYDRGTCYLKIGNFVPGILDFSRALELQPRYADQFYNKVYQVSYVVDLNRVITELNKIVADHPDVSYVIFLRGFFYVAKTEFKKYDRADLDSGIRDFDKTLQLNPKHVSALIYRGFLFFKAAQIEKGEERAKLFAEGMSNYKTAMERDPESGIAHFLTSMTWSVLSQEPGIDDAERKKRVDTAVEELRISIEDKQFKGFDRIKNDKGFEAIRNDSRVVKLTSGK